VIESSYKTSTERSFTLAIRTKNPFDATHRAEIIFSRSLEALGFAEEETDYEIAFFTGKPSRSQLATLTPEGWNFLEAHVTSIEEFDLDDSDDAIAWESPYFGEDFDDLDLSVEEFELQDA
jgi:hypothetical protein